MLLSRLLYKMLFNFQSEELTWLKALTINNLLKYIDMYIFICRVPFMFPSTWIWTPHFHYLLWWSEVSDLYSTQINYAGVLMNFFPLIVLHGSRQLFLRGIGFHYKGWLYFQGEEGGGPRVCQNRKSNFWLMNENFNESYHF